MNYILLQKQESIFIFKKSLNQYPNVKAQTSDEIQPKENYEKRNVVLDDLLLSKQESNIDLFFFTWERHNNVDFHYKYQNYFHLPKKLFVIILIKIFYLNKL